MDAGISLDLPIDAHIDGTAQNFYPIYNKYNIDRATETPNTTPGLSLGFGIKLPISKYLLLINPSYNLGFSQDYGNYSDMLFDRYFRLSAGLEWR